MWKVLFLVAALSVSISPIDAREAPRDKREKRDEQPADLRRDVERISREIYPARSAPEDRGSLAAGRSLKKR